MILPLALALLLAQPAPTPAPAPTPEPTQAPTPAPEPTQAPAPEVAPTPAPEAEPTPAPEVEPAPADTDSIKVEVIALRPSGQIIPVATEVRLERRRQPPPAMGGAPSTTMTLLATTNASGIASFPAPPPLGIAESDRVIARFKGQEVVVPLTPERNGRLAPIRLVVREMSRDLSRLRLDVRVALVPMDTVLRVEHVFRFENPSHTTLDADKRQGLLLPLLVPAPFGEPAHGLFPGRPDPNELIIATQPDLGRVVVENGDVVYRGPIPSEGLAIRIVMALPYDGQTTSHLGLTAPVDLSALAVILQSPIHLAPKLASDRPGELLTRPSQGGEERTLTLRTPPKAGETVLFTLSDTPDRHGFIRPLAAGLSLVVIGALLLLLLASRHRTPKA